MTSIVSKTTYFMGNGRTVLWNEARQYPARFLDFEASPFSEGRAEHEISFGEGGLFRTYPPSRFWASAASTDIGLISGVRIDVGISAGRADLGFTDVQMAVNPYGKSSITSAKSEHR